MKFCSDCTYLKVDTSKGGKCFCAKIKKEVWANNDGCKNFENAYSRSSYDKEKIYEEAKSSQNKSSGNLGLNIFIAIVLVVLLIVLKLFGVL